MKSLHEIKDEVAIQYGFSSFDKLIDQASWSSNFDIGIEEIVNEVSKRYAIESATASLAKAAENARIHHEFYHHVDRGSIVVNEVKKSIPIKGYYSSEHQHGFRINEESITSPDNIVTL